LEYFGDYLVILSYPGIATILAFQSGATKALRIVPDKALHIVPDEDDNDIDIAVAKLKKKICQEVDCNSIDKSSYKSHLDYNDASELVSNTLLNLLSSLLPTTLYQLQYAHRKHYYICIEKPSNPTAGLSFCGTPKNWWRQ